MHLAGQGETARRTNERGYAMAALIIGLSIMAVMMIAALPVWKQLATREKEAELVFRGEQYAHAIGMFQRRTANAFPPNLDVLVQQKYLRKKYKDPITNDDFAPLVNAPNAGRGGQAGQAGPGGAQGRGQQPAGAAAPGGQVPVGGIIGVTSKSTDASIRLYKGRSHYNEWAFVYTPPAAAPGTGGPGGVGAPGRGTQGRGQGAGQGPQLPNLPGSGGGLPGRGQGGRGPGGQGGRGGPFGPGGQGGPIPGGGRGR